MANLKEKIRDVIRLTDLSDYLKISRPTLYKLIEMYDDDEYEKIDKKKLELFNYINDTPKLSKKQVINFIVQNQIMTSEGDERDSLASFVGKYEYTGSIGEEQDEVIRNVITNKNISVLINLINRYCFLTTKEKLTDNEIEELVFINYIKDLVSRKETLPDEIIKEYKMKKRLK